VSAYLGLPPEERDAVVEWLWEHRKQLITEFGVDRYKDSKGEPLVNSKAKIGALVAYAPGDIAGRMLTAMELERLGLFKQLLPQINTRGMLEAYDREREFMPILLDNERVGFGSICAACGRTLSSTSQPLSRRMLGYARGLRHRTLIWMLTRRLRKLLRKLELSMMTNGHLRQLATKRQQEKPPSHHVQRRACCQCIWI
jgi:hypothetical protein